jgi:hypothetical protein
MAKPGKNPKYLDVKEAVEKVENQAYNYRRIQSLYDARLSYIGKVSGRQYDWSGAGVVVEVLEDDVPELLSKRIGQRSCCGEGLLGNKVFEEVK